jgi:hypothetical protein
MSLKVMKSRKPKKVNRKSKSQKPVKKSQKPVKKSRKPKKTSRKPVKKSRKPVKKSRKPKKTSRKPVKKSRKPKKTSRKPKKTSRKPKKTVPAANKKQPKKVRKYMVGDMVDSFPATLSSTSTGLRPYHGGNIRGDMAGARFFDPKIVRLVRNIREKDDDYDPEIVGKRFGETKIPPGRF